MGIDFGRVAGTSSEGEVRVINLVLNGSFQVVWAAVYTRDLGTGEFCLVFGHGPDAT